MKYKIIAALIAIVIVSGCSGMPDLPNIPGVNLGSKTSITSGRALEITSFTAEPSSIFSGANVRVSMEVENQGDASVPDSQSLVYLTGSNFDDWSGTHFYHFNKMMKSADAVRGMPAETKKFTWSLTAPSIEAGQKRKDTFIGRVYQDYKSTANGNIWIYSEFEANAAKASGKQLYTPSFTYSKGPVCLGLSFSPEPIVLYDSEKTFMMYIKVNNLASGTIYYPGSVKYQIGSENIEVDPMQMNWVTVSVEPSSGLGVNGCEGDRELTLGEATMACEVTVNRAPETLESYALEVIVDYGYFTERTASVTVEGRQTIEPT
ncbi:MAG: hypothetical protein V1678_04920 [Candidatus Aenigmatarchaeota archaeon]